MARKCDLADFTRSGLERLEREWLSEKGDPRDQAKTTFQIKFQEKIKKKEINPGTLIKQRRQRP